MIYVYECPTCSRSAERICTVDERNEPFHCVECADLMARVPSFGGGLKTEHPVWLDHHVRGSIQDPGDVPITTRKEHDIYCKEKGIVQL